MKKMSWNYEPQNNHFQINNYVSNIICVCCPYRIRLLRYHAEYFPLYHLSRQWKLCVSALHLSKKHAAGCTGLHSSSSKEQSLI